MTAGPPRGRPPGEVVTVDVPRLVAAPAKAEPPRAIAPNEAQPAVSPRPTGRRRRRARQREQLAAAQPGRHRCDSCVRLVGRRSRCPGAQACSRSSAGGRTSASSAAAAIAEGAPKVDAGHPSATIAAECRRARPRLPGARRPPALLPPCRIGSEVGPPTVNSPAVAPGTPRTTMRPGSSRVRARHAVDRVAAIAARITAETHCIGIIRAELPAGLAAADREIQRAWKAMGRAEIVRVRIRSDFLTVATAITMAGAFQTDGKSLDDRRCVWRSVWRSVWRGVCWHRRIDRDETVALWATCLARSTIIGRLAREVP